MNEPTGSTTGNPIPAVESASTNQQAAAPAPWYGTDLDPSTAQWVQSKNIPNAAAALTSYHNLEKLLGADKAGRALIPPKDDAAPEEVAAFWGKLGRPETADGYKLPVPEGDSGAFAKQAAQWLHEANVPAKTAEALASKWNEFSASHKAQQELQIQAKATQDEQALKAEWGGKFDENVELARRSIREAGLPSDKATAIERAIGLAEATKLFAFLGQQYREAPIKGGVGDGPGRFAASAETAKARIGQLRNDIEFSKKLTNGDATARDEWNALHKIAYGA